MRKKFLAKMFVIVLILNFIFLFPSNILADNGTAKGWKEFTEMKNVPLNKKWTITFNHEVELSSLIDDNIYVLDSTNGKVPVTIVQVDEGKQVLVSPPNEGYKPNSSYTLYISENVYSKERKLMKHPVKMPFRTGSSEVPVDSFQPRAESENIVELKEDVVDLSKRILTDLETLDYEGNLFVFIGAPEELSHLSVGDIFILPPTEDFPFGWSKEIITIEFDGSHTIIETKEPNMEDVIDKIDISQIIAIEAKDVMLDPEVYPNIISEEGRGNHRNFKVANRDEMSIGEIEIGMDGDNVFVEFSDIVLKEQNLGEIKIEGKLESNLPEVFIDVQRMLPNRIEFVSGIEESFTLKYEFIGVEAEKYFNLGTPIPVKAYGVAGAEIQFYIKISGSGEVSLDFSLTSSREYRLGIKNGENGIEVYNDSTTATTPNIDGLTGTLTGKVGLGVGITAKIIQFELGGIEADAGYRAKIEGQISPGKICYTLSDSLYFDTTSRYRVSPTNFEKGKLLTYSIALSKGTTCDFIDILVEPVVLRGGEKTTLKLTGLDPWNISKDIELPDNKVSLKSNDTSIAGVNQFGDVVIYPEAKDGESTTITITYDRGKWKNPLTKEVEVIVQSNEDVYHIEMPTFEEMKIMAGDIGGKLKGVLESGANPTKDDFSTIVDGLKQYATDDYIYDELKPYYEEHVYSTIDVYLFPLQVDTDLVFDILEAKGNRVVVQTVERGNANTDGSHIIYTFKYENGRWLVDDYQSISLGSEPLPALTTQEVEQYLSNYYSKSNYNEEVNVTYLTTGTRKLYNYYTGRHENRTYYRYHITTTLYEYVEDFFIHNGSIVNVEWSG
ncbi:Ig-like domain-containing protein [Sporosarcina sp. P33]|uniref:Ig-like domain-containing protein n=1 Tax=Sporosarcina sp. P33 TaxID=1930764 RepID=UPI0009C0583F|nr:Ig-like domain-containing protein [Sporosarcina sp. P33]ARD48857.1 hypothetical protein SporoP33_11890 [Sporosarcina sp. P33]